MNKLLVPAILLMAIMVGAVAASAQGFTLDGKGSATSHGAKGILEANAKSSTKAGLEIASTKANANAKAGLETANAKAGAKTGLDAELSNEKAGNAERAAKSLNVTITAEKEAELKAQIPAQFSDAQAKIVTVQGKFLFWTHDGNHIMWGKFGSGYFAGTDDLGKQTWGIYGNGYFAGFYDGTFFYGKYRNGYWKSTGLFGETESYGRYALFNP